MSCPTLIAEGCDANLSWPHGLHARCLCRELSAAQSAQKYGTGTSCAWAAPRKKNATLAAPVPLTPSSLPQNSEWPG